MVSRPLLFLSALLVATASVQAQEEPFGDGSSREAGTAEAQRLYDRANDFVSSMKEGEYSYAYIQFYWKRAQANLERITKVYPGTPVARDLVAGERKIGPFELNYFRDRVLSNIAEKQRGAFDAINCAIYLYNLDETRWDETRLATMESIVEVLARQKRWNEALIFPVRQQDRARLLTTIFRVAARYDQQPAVKNLIANAKPEELPLLWPLQAEADTLLGKPREGIAKLLDAHPEEAVRLAVLRGMATREIEIQRRAALRRNVGENIAGVHYQLSNLSVRDDVDGFAHTLFPKPVAAAQNILAHYHAALGRRPAAGDSIEAHEAYLDYLGAFEKFDELVRYLNDSAVPAEIRSALQPKAVEVYSYYGRAQEADRLRASYGAHSRAQADAATLAQFRGLADADNALTVRETTFADLDIKDPCLVAQAIMQWSLAPTRALRGAAPWDRVVYKFSGGFTDLPEPKSKEVQDAAATLKPF